MLTMYRADPLTTHDVEKEQALAPVAKFVLGTRAQARACGRRCRLSREPRVLAARARRLEKSATRRHSPGFGATRVERRQTATMKRVLAWLRAKEYNSLRSASG